MENKLSWSDKHITPKLRGYKDFVTEMENTSPEVFFQDAEIKFSDKEKKYLNIYYDKDQDLRQGSNFTIEVHFESYPEFKIRPEFNNTSEIIGFINSQDLSRTNVLILQDNIEFSRVKISNEGEKYKVLSDIWANEHSIRTDLSQGMTQSQIDEKQSYYYRLYEVELGIETPPVSKYLSPEEARSLIPEERQGESFHIKVSKMEAEALIANSVIPEIMNKEYGDDDHWMEMTANDFTDGESAKLDDDYQTFEIFIHPVTEAQLKALLWEIKRIEVRNATENNQNKEIVGRISFFDLGEIREVVEYTSAEKYISALKKELFSNPNGFQHETVMRNPVLWKEVDDILYGEYGEENPNSLEFYIEKFQKKTENLISSNEDVQNLFSPKTDLFEAYEVLPEELKAICDKWQQKEVQEGLDYKDCEFFHKECEAIGYTFDYGLDAVPFDLRPMSLEKQQLQDQIINNQNMDIMGTTNNLSWYDKNITPITRAYKDFVKEMKNTSPEIFFKDGERTFTAREIKFLEILKYENSKNKISVPHSERRVPETSKEIAENIRNESTKGNLSYDLSDLNIKPERPSIAENKESDIMEFADILNKYYEEESMFDFTHPKSIKTLELALYLQSADEKLKEEVLTYIFTEPPREPYFYDFIDDSYDRGQSYYDLAMESYVLERENYDLIIEKANLVFNQHHFDTDLIHESNVERSPDAFKVLMLDLSTVFPDQIKAIIENSNVNGHTIYDNDDEKLIYEEIKKLHKERNYELLADNFSAAKEIALKINNLERQVKNNNDNNQNPNIMKTTKEFDQVQYLKDQLKYLGFGEDEKLHKDLGKGIKSTKQQFEIKAASDKALPGNTVDFILKFKKTESGAVFFNSYHAKLTNEKNEEITHNFPVNRENTFTAKEAVNLLEGRSVKIEFHNPKTDQVEPAFVKLDFNEPKTEKGNYNFQNFYKNYGIDTAEIVEKSNLVFDKPEYKANTIKSLEKGNVVKVKFEMDEGVIEGRAVLNPQYKSLNLYDQDMNRINTNKPLQGLENEAGHEKANVREQSIKR